MVWRHVADVGRLDRGDYAEGSQFSVEQDLGKGGDDAGKVLVVESKDGRWGYRAVR